MPLYSFESLHSAPRIIAGGNVAMVDTSYLIAVNSFPAHHFSAPADALYRQLFPAATAFFINVIVRHEHAKHVRAGLMALAMQALAADPATEARYRAILRLGPTADLNKNIVQRYEVVFKDHIRQGDTQRVLGNMSKDTWAESIALETAAGMTYFSAGGTVQWDDLGQIVSDTGMAPTDCMIANFAIDIQANAILTCDCDYAQVSPLIDVYMPLSVAQNCSVYDPASD